MDYHVQSDTITIHHITNFDLQQTLNCGQCFRWKEEDGGFTGVVKDKVVTAYFKNRQLTLKNCSEEDFLSLWQNYFDLHRDYGKIRKDLSGLNPILKKAAGYAPGIRILNQDPWEALCTFILSQNNNIPRIQGIVQRLCEAFGSPITGNHFTFPGAETLAPLSVEDLAPIRSGFRAKYVLDAAQKVANKEVELSALRSAPLPQAKETLMQIKGVGPKVADCALLYGLHRLECFPMDVWMTRAMATLFPGVEASSFGDYAGIAQQYIFHYSRMNPQLFEQACG